MIKEYVETKLEYKNLPVLISAIRCGIAMGFVTVFSVVLGTMTTNVILSKFIFGAAFTSFLLLVVLNKYDLFTGNTMLLTSVYKKGKTKRILQNLFFVYFGNLAGCIFAAAIIKLTGLHQNLSLTQPFLQLFITKTEMHVLKMLLFGILANYLVCMSVFLSFKAKAMTEKYLSLFFPICIFCVLGFEHSVANMFTLFYSLFISGGNFGGLVLNLIFVTLGNIIGGVLFAVSTLVKDRIIPPKVKE